MHRPQALQTSRSISTGTSPVRGWMCVLNSIACFWQTVMQRPQPLQNSGKRKGFGRSEE